jgi:hypothetical protein
MKNTLAKTSALTKFIITVQRVKITKQTAALSDMTIGNGQPTFKGITYCYIGKTFAIKHHRVHSYCYY